MSLKLTGVIILLIIAFLAGAWFEANQSEGTDALHTFKNYIGRTVRGEGICPKNMACKPK